MDVSAVSSSLGGLAAAQMMFDAASRVGATAGVSEGAGSDGASGTTPSETTAVGVAVLGMAHDAERSLVNILA